MNNLIGKILEIEKKQYLVYSQIIYKNDNVVLLLDKETEEISIYKIVYNQNSYYLDEIGDSKIVDKFITLLSI